MEDLEGCFHWEQGQGAPPQPDDDDDDGIDDDGGDGDGGDKYQVWQGAPPQAGVEILIGNLKFPPQTWFHGEYEWKERKSWSPPAGHRH